MFEHQYLFRALLVASCGYALWCGRKEERIVAVACLLAVVLTKFVVSPLSGRYAGVEAGLVAIDLAMLAAFVAIALQSERFWPLWVAGLQLTGSTAHMMKHISPDLLPKAYGAAAALWSYPILIVLAIGVWRGRRRDLRQGDPAPT
jgi:hypothetical protein